MKTLVPILGRVLTNSFIQILLVVLLVGSGAHLYLPLRASRQLKERLAKARAERVELEACYPIYLELARLDVPAKWPELVLPKPEKLSERDIASVTDRFMQIATNSLIELGAASPRVQLDDQGRRYLAVELRATGPYLQLRAFLLGLAQMPALERIERLEVRREALQEQFNVAVRLALE
jgi:hypothetical protein